MMARDRRAPLIRITTTSVFYHNPVRFFMFSGYPREKWVLQYRSDSDEKK